MGYYLQSFISNKNNFDDFINKYTTSSILELKQNISLILLSENLFHEINGNTKSKIIKGFEYLTSNLEEQIKSDFSNKPIGYIEAEYWGGEGSQSAIIWYNNKRILEVFNSQDCINKVLKFFGVAKAKGYDEFDTLEFSLLKSDRSWDSY